MHSETGGAKASVGCNKTVHWRHGEPGLVRYDFQRAEVDAANFRSLRYGRCFHVHCGRSVSYTQLLFLFRPCYGIEAHQRPLAGTCIGPGAVSCVDHGTRLEYFAYPQPRI